MLCRAKVAACSQINTKNKGSVSRMYNFWMLNLLVHQVTTSFKSLHTYIPHLPTFRKFLGYVIKFFVSSLAESLYMFLCVRLNRQTEMLYRSKTTFRFKYETEITTFNRNLHEPFVVCGPPSKKHCSEGHLFMRHLILKIPVVIYLPPSWTFKTPTCCLHRTFMCFVWISEQTTLITRSCCKENNHSLYSIKCVYCAVRTES
jgi:hypothetical protein